MRQRQLRIGVWLTMVALWMGLIPTATQAATNEQIILNVEEPGSGSVYSGVGNIRGWAVAPQGIQRIELAIDGAYRTNIPSGGLRTDVGDAYPTYPNADESGFSMAFNYSNLASGPHTITVRAVDGRGDDRVVTSTFNVTRFDNAYISDPSAVSLTNSTVSHDATTVYLNNLLVDGIPYNLHLRWQPSTQGFAIEAITKVDNFKCTFIAGSWRGTASYLTDSLPITLLLNQNGCSITGTIESPESAPSLCEFSDLTAITGNVSGNNFYLTIPEDPLVDYDTCKLICYGTDQGNLTVEGDKMYGTIKAEDCEDGGFDNVYLDLEFLNSAASLEILEERKADIEKSSLIRIK